MTQPDAMPERPMVAADAHVHIHDCHPLGPMLSRAFESLSAAARAAGGAAGARAVLLLSEAEPDDAFSKLANAAASASGQDGLATAGAWRFAPTAEPGAVVARSGGRELSVVAGRQVACAEDLEVLTLCCAGRIPDGLAIDETLARARALGAVAVVPWGPGKWLGARGRLLSRLIDTAPPGGLFLGDESSRPLFWGEPRHFAAARRRGLAILPGTDPLPFPHEATRAGSFGFTTRMAFDPERPAASLVAHLGDGAAEIRPFGRLERPLRFVRNQIAMQVRKRRRKRAA